MLGLLAVIERARFIVGYTDEVHRGLHRGSGRHGFEGELRWQGLLRCTWFNSTPWSTRNSRESLQATPTIPLQESTQAVSTSSFVYITYVCCMIWFSFIYMVGC
jgi:hypothetical protein